MTETITTTTPTLESLTQYTGFTSTVVDHDGNNRASLTTGERHQVFIGRVEIDRHDVLLHRIVTVDVPPSRNGWIAEYTTDAGMVEMARVHGSLVSPTPEHGKHYRLLTDGGQGMLVQYIDDDHAEDRHRMGSPWNILAGPDAPWYTDRDSLYTIEGNTYVEVEAPEEPSVDRQEEPEVATIENVLTNNTFGMGKANEDGRCVLNPEPVIGRHYLYWRTWSDSESYLGTYVHATPNDEDNKNQRILGYRRVIRMGGNRSLHNSTDMVSMDGEIPDTLKWVEVATVKPELADDEAQQARRSALRISLNQLATGFSDLNEAMNEVAEEQSWCSEYEDIVRPLGFEGRESQKRDYNVEVKVTFTLEDESPSSRVDSYLNSAYGIDVSADYVEIKGTVTFTIRASEMSSQDDARDYVDTDTVQEELDNLTSASVNVEDWSIEGVYED